MKTNCYLAMFCALFSMPVSIAWATEPMGSHSEIVRVFRALWGDDVESKVDVIDAAATINESKIDALDVQLESLGVIPITSSFISAGTITLSTAGHYTLAEDLTANIDITASCISLDLNHRSLTGIVTVDGGSDIADLELYNGFLLPPAPATAPSAGITVDSGVSKLSIFNIILFCTDTSASAVAGRTGMEIAGDEVNITNCHITAGAAGNATSGDGFDGGDGIELTSTSTNAIIRDCAIFGGNGGDTEAGLGTTAGRGGHGIFVNAASNAQIVDCIVLLTGAGGDGAETGGAGGDGVNIVSTSDDIEVAGCTLRNTGAAGAGGSPAAGKAINDSVPAADPGKSIILSNIGHNIADTATRFNIGNAGEKGISLTYPPTTTAVNVYANVYVV